MTIADRRRRCKGRESKGQTWNGSEKTENACSTETEQLWRKGSLTLINVIDVILASILVRS